MSLHDVRGVPLSTGNRQSLDRFETAVSLLNGFYLDPLAEIEAALDADPDFVMGHCLRAALFLMSTEKAAEPEARRSIQAATALAGHANERERGHLAALAAWLAGDLERASRLYGDVLTEYPRDALALQVGHQTDFFLGRSTMIRDRVARVLPDWDPAVPGYGFVLGMYAFGLEETNLYAEAEAAGRQAVAINPRDPWAIHAVAHVLEMQGRVAEGIDWLTARSDDWAPDNMLAYHNWWHLALYHMDQGDTARVLDLYDLGVRPADSQVAMEMVDASAMLWRLHLRGVDVGDRWRSVADAWEPLAGDACYAFNDAHAVMAFVATGRGKAIARVEAAQARRVAAGGTNAMMTAEVGRPLCQGLAAFGRGDYAAAVDLLLPLPAVAHRFGGSHAQRDVIAQTLIEAAFRSGQVRLARALLNERTALKPKGAENWQAMARALALLGQPVAAEKAVARARRLQAAVRPAALAG